MKRYRPIVALTLGAAFLLSGCGSVDPYDPFSLTPESVPVIDVEETAASEPTANGLNEASADTVRLARIINEPKRSIGEELWYSIHVIFHPFDGFWDIKHEKRGSVKGATTILVITILAFMYQSVGRGWLFNPYGGGTSYLMASISVVLPVALWVLSNWCLTTLFDGEGSLKDVYIATCYALTPLPLFVIPLTIVSNFVALDEIALIGMLLTIAYVWTGFLIFFGMMTIHDYTLGKNVIISIFTLLGVAIIMFIAMLFTGLIQKVVTFVYNIVVEIQFRIQ